MDLKFYGCEFVTQDREKDQPSTDRLPNAEPLGRQTTAAVSAHAGSVARIRAVRLGLMNACDHVWM